MMNSEQIPVQICSASCVGYINDIFPRGYGNYISTYDSNTETLYEIVNLSYEDLEDAISQGIIDTNTIEANVYGSYESTSWKNKPITIKVAFITDSRFPEVCLTPEWWYGERNKFRVEILRHKYQVPDGVCLCQFEDSREAGIFIGSIGYHQEDYHDYKGYCYECKTPYRLVKRRNK